MYSVTATLDTSAPEKVLRAAKMLPNLTRREVRRLAMPHVERRVQDTLMQPPGPVQYTDNGRLRWASEKQRRYVIGYVLDKDAAGNIIPYERTGEYEEGWEVELLTVEDGGVIVVRNPVPYAAFVGGAWQQPYHEDTGWSRARMVIEELQADMAEIMPYAWRNVTRAWTGL